MDFRVLLVFVMVFASWATAEIIKFIVDASVNKRADVRIFLGYGGFPSAHSALVSSLCTSLLLIQGFSVSFAISLVLGAFCFSALACSSRLRRAQAPLMLCCSQTSSAFLWYLSAAYLCRLRASRGLRGWLYTVRR